MVLSLKRTPEIILTLNLILSLIYIVEGEEEPCFNYVNEKPIMKCGFQPQVKPDATSARIINGKEATRYPWMAFLQIKREKDEDWFIDPPKNKYGWARATGALILEKLIITCAHCICTEEPGRRRPYYATCPEDADGWDEDKNLNIEDLFEIYITVGEAEVNVNKRDWTYDRTITAYAYKYANMDAEYGDVGVVIKEGGHAAFSKEGIGSLCLPTPETYNSNNGIINVKLAGWGFRYDEFKSDEDEVTETSCQTNEGRRLPNMQTVNSYENRVVFLECKKPGNILDPVPDEFCSNVLLNEEIETFSVKTPKTAIEDAIDENKVDGIKNTPGFKTCQAYMKLARVAWMKHMREKNPEITEDMFDKKVDRIIVRNVESNKDLEICYNVKKLGAHGICSTEKSNPYQWGFCSRSCSRKFLYEKRGQTNTHLEAFEAAEEAEFVYYENAPTADTNFRGK